MGLVVDTLELRDWRNFEQRDIAFSPGMTVLVGPNAVGKTNTVEALQMLTAGMSFRHPRPVQLVREGCESAKATVNLTGDGRVIDVSCIVESSRRKFRRNGKPCQSSDVPSDVMTFRDLLYGFMLTSGNDGANAVAVLVSGNVESFVDRMNKRAEELGCEGTHFANPHGYHDPQHYSTALDLARIASEAVKLDSFRKITSTPSYTMNIHRGNVDIEQRVTNSNALLKKDNTYYYPDCIGIKTGYHSLAGQCFVGAAERDGVRLVTVDLHSEGSLEKWIDTIRLFNFGFTRYTGYTMEEMFNFAGDRIATLRVSNAIDSDPYDGMLNLKIAQISDPDYTRMVENDNEAAMEAAVQDFVSRCELTVTSNMVAPVSQGEIIGRLRYLDQSGREITALLVADRDIAEQPVRAKLTDMFPALSYFENPLVVLLALVLILLIIALLIAGAVRGARKDRRRKKIYEARRLEYMRRMSAQRRRDARRRGRRK